MSIHQIQIVAVRTRTRNTRRQRKLKRKKPRRRKLHIRIRKMRTGNGRKKAQKKKEVPLKEFEALMTLKTQNLLDLKALTCGPSKAMEHNSGYNMSPCFICYTPFFTS